MVSTAIHEICFPTEDTSKDKLAAGWVWVGTARRGGGPAKIPCQRGDGKGEG